MHRQEGREREAMFKLLSHDVFNWAVDNSLFSRFAGCHSAALMSVVRRGRKGWVEVTCKEHTHTRTHTENTGGLRGIGEHGGEGSTSLIALLIKKPVARRSTPIVS